MASIIVNQGAGPVPYELEGTVVLGSNPSCEVVLEHPTALGCRVELKPLRWGYRVVLMKGDMQLNEETCELADLEHNDTLRIGEVMVLYKQPEGAEGFAGAAASEELPELEALDELESLEALEPLAVHEEVDDLEQLPELEALPSQELDVALDRARWKRLEALRRVKESRAGSMEFFPDIAKDRVLDDSRQMEETGAAAELLAYETEHDLADKTVKQLLDLAAVAQVETEREAAAQKEREAAERQEREAAEERAREEETQARLEAERLEQEAAEERAREQARKEQEEADALAAAELEALPELEELPELETLDESVVPEALPAFESSDEVLSPIVAPTPTPTPATDAVRTASRMETPASVRPLPSGGVRFQRPLPPGHRAPTFLPPARPVRRSA